MANLPVRGMPFATLPLSNTDLFYVVQGTASGSNDRKVQYKDLTNDSAVTPGTYGDSTHVGQFTVDQKGRISAASNVSISGGGGGGGGGLDFFPQADIGALETPTVENGNFTVGFGFLCTRSLTVTGIKFFWNGGAGTLTIKCSIWDAGTNFLGTLLLASGNATVNAQGFYTVTFGGPLVLTVGHFYTIGTYETTGTKWNKWVPITPTIVDGAYTGMYVLTRVKMFRGGDGIPNSSDSAFHTVQIVATLT